MERVRVARKLQKSYDLGAHAPLYGAQLIGLLKEARAGRKGPDTQPYVLDFGPLKFYVARYFGFCKGVENAIDMAYAELTRRVGRRTYMLSELIHNPFVNEDLQKRGLRFLKTADGQTLTNPQTGRSYWAEVTPEDVVIIPAFGATMEDKARLAALGVDLTQCDATCWFVENVWIKSEELGRRGFTIVIHGKFRHEETQATFSYARQFAPTLVVPDMAHTLLLAEIIAGVRPMSDFQAHFGGRHSEGFDPVQHLQHLAVVNQTTMLASETQAIADALRGAMHRRFGDDEHFADTKNTLCYATNNNQSAVMALLEHPADAAIIIGGRNSSNTSHLVELCEKKLPTYFIQSEADISSRSDIRHFDCHAGEERTTHDFLPEPARILIAAGASCPDAVVEHVMMRLLSYYPDALPPETVFANYIRSLA